MKDRVTSLMLAALSVMGCGTSTVPVGNLDRVLDLATIPNRNVDILFVIDNSPSMLDSQASLVASFPIMMDQLATLEGGLPNLHIGVVTSDMGSMGSLDGSPGPHIGSGPGECNGYGSDGVLQNYDGTTMQPAAELGGALYISDIRNPDGTRTRNYTGELRDVFTKIASVGASGCGFEQHFAAMRRALTNPANGDFLRPNANLAVVFLADEDDCSMTHSSLLGNEASGVGPLQSFRCTRFGLECDDEGVSSDDMNQLGPKGDCRARTDSPHVEDVTPFVDFLVSLKDDPRAVMVAAIAAPPSPVVIELATPPGGGVPIPALAHSCAYANVAGDLEVADPAVRMAQLIDAFPGRGNFSTLCSADLSVSLSSVGYAAKKLMGDPCIDIPLVDTSDAEGSQPLCVVLDGTEPMPACDGTNSDHCWGVVGDMSSCSASPEHLRFTQSRAVAPTENYYVSVRCLRAQ